MNFLRKNALFFGILLAFLVLFGGSVALLMKTIRASREVETDRDQKRDERRTLWDRKPFPSNRNIKMVQDNRKNEGAIVAGMLKEYRKVMLAPEPMEELKAKGEILRKSRELTDLLDKAQVRHPERFQFGFDRYSNYPPKREHTPLLLKQLRAMEELIKLVAEAHVYEIVSAKRAEFEDSFGEGKPSTSYNPSTEPLISMDGKFECVDQPNYLYSVMPFEVEIVCDTDALRTLLDELARSPFVFLPRILTIENEKKEGMSATRSAADSVAAPTDRFPSPMTGRVPGAFRTPGEASARPKTGMVDPTRLPYVMGQERIKVGMRVDWLEFHPGKPLQEREKKPAGGR